MRLGRVYEINAAQTPTPVERELAHLTPSTPQLLAGRTGAVYRHVSGNPTLKQTVLLDDTAVLPDAEGNFLFDPSDTQPVWDDGFAEVNVYYHLDRMHTFFRDGLGLGAEMDDPAYSL